MAHYTVTVLKSHSISQKEKCECINAVLVDMAALLALTKIFWLCFLDTYTLRRKGSI